MNELGAAVAAALAAAAAQPPAAAFAATAVAQPPAPALAPPAPASSTPTSMPTEYSAFLAARGRCPECDEAFRVFACLWGQMQLLRLTSSLCRGRWTLLEWLSATGSTASAVLLSCIMCVAAPGEATAFAAVGSSLANVWSQMPDEVDSGGLLELLVHSNLLAGLAWSLLTGRPAYEGWAACGPAIRCLMAVVMVFVSLARLNREYHNVRRSANTALVLQLADSLLSRMGLTKIPNVFGVTDRLLLFGLRCALYAIEALGLAMPLCLWWGDASVGLSLLWMHCIVLTLITSFDLPCVLVACMPFWVPPRHVLALRWMTLAPLARSSSLALAFALSPPLMPGIARMDRRHRMAALLWLCAAGPLQYTTPGPEILAATASSEESGCSCGFKQQSEAGAMVVQVARATVALAVLNGLCPYLGLKTQAAWTMFSNLSVEGGATNHFFIPASWQIFGYTDECVTVTKTDVLALHAHHVVVGSARHLRALGDFAERNGLRPGIHACAVLNTEGERRDFDTLLPYTVPFAHLRRLVATQAMPLLQDFYVEYLHLGAPHRFEVRRGQPLSGSDLRLARPPQALLRKLIAFRSSPVAEPGGGPGGACCAH